MDGQQKERLAKVAIAHAGTHAFAHRRDKKNDFRRLWTVKINAATRASESPISYSKFIDSLKKKKYKTRQENPSGPCRKLAGII